MQPSSGAVKSWGTVVAERGAVVGRPFFSLTVLTDLDSIPMRNLGESLVELSNGLNLFFNFWLVEVEMKQTHTPSPHPWG